MRWRFRVAAWGWRHGRRRRRITGELTAAATLTIAASAESIHLKNRLLFNLFEDQRNIVHLTTRAGKERAYYFAWDEPEITVPINIARFLRLQCVDNLDLQGLGDPEQEWN